jgi:hypothetical protein
MSCKQTNWNEKVSAVSPPPVCWERGKLVAAALVHRRTLSKQSLLTPEICINKVSRNSRLTAVGRQATATDSHPQNCLQTLIFFFSLSTFDETTTELNLNAEKLTETVFHLNLGHFVVFLFCFVWFCSILFFPVCFPFDETTTELLLRAPPPGLEVEGQTPKLLRLKLYYI